MNGRIAVGARFIGQRIPRKEDGRLLTGRGSFVDDVVLPGMLHAAFVRGTVARGKIISVDLAEARATPGVWAIYTAEDFVPLNIRMVTVFLDALPPTPPVHPLASDRVAYVGEPVALVVAESRAIAEDAVARVRVEYETETPLVTIDDALHGPPVHPGMGSNVAMHVPSPENPEVATIFASAPHVVTGTIRHQRIAHSPMEARGIVASRQGRDELTIYASSQGPQFAARAMALTFGLSPARIRVITKDVGGAFGLKCQPWREEVAVVAACLLIDRPVKWIEDRLENLVAANQAREQTITMRIGLDTGGKLLAAHADYAYNNGASPHYLDANAFAMALLWAAYKMPHETFDAKAIYSNTVGLAAYRGPWGMESLAREVMLDIAARQIGVDPIEIRRRNLVTAADQPHTSNFGLVLEDTTPSRCLDALLQELDVPAFRAEQTAARAAGRYLGLGVATYIEPTAVSGYPSLASDVAHIRIDPTGKVTAVLSTHSQGQGNQTTMAQVIADTLGVPYDDVTVFDDDSAAGGYGPGAVGSRQAVAGGGASIKAAQILLDKLKRVAAHLFNANPDGIRISDGMVHVTGTGEMTHSLAQIAEIAYGEPGRLPPGMEAGLEASYRFSPPPMTFSSAAHACIVEVDSETGFVEIKRWICSEDCGVIINPSIVEGQIAGGIAQAIGAVLMENAHHDEYGNPTAVTFKDYLLPTIADVPDIEFIHIATPAKSDGGFRGVGEGGAIIGPPTLVNAIADALAPFSARCLDLPLTPSKILALMAQNQVPTLKTPSESSDYAIPQG